MAKKIVIFGGAFDPITPSHVDSTLIASTYFDEVWIMPCFKSLFGKNMADFHHRITMSVLAVMHLPNVYVTDVESTMPNSKSIDLLEGVISYFCNYSDDIERANIYFMLGGDNVEKMHTWPHVELLKKYYNFFIIPREGYAIPEGDMWYKHHPHIISDKRPIGGSSTQIRNLIANNQFLPIDFSPQIAAYIDKHGLYKPSIDIDTKPE